MQVMHSTIVFESHMCTVSERMRTRHEYDSFFSCKAYKAPCQGHFKAVPPGVDVLTVADIYSQGIVELVNN